jgi:glycosyltransferase involved in cell wall biosynthesis
VSPRVSVLLPAWNAQDTIDAALASLRRQTFDDWECLTVDDGSCDGTAKIVSRYAAVDSRILLVQAPHAGLVGALNRGLELCRGEFIARMDADDVMHRERLGRQVSALVADSSLAAIGCHVRIFPRGRMSPRRREYEFWLNSLRTAADVSRDAFIECPVAHPTLMMRREFARLRYVECGWPEDYDLILRGMAEGFRIGVLPQRLHAWRGRPDSLSRTSANYEVARFTACKAHHLARGFLAPVKTYVLWGYGHTGRMLRRALGSYAKLPSHIIEVKRSRIGQRIHGAPVVPIDALSALRGERIVVSVARAGPRSQIRGVLNDLGFREGADYVCAA